MGKTEDNLEEYGLDFDLDFEEIEEETETDMSVDQFLDQQDLARMEYDRMEQDLYPLGPEFEDSQDANAGHIHTGDDPVQAWLAHQRREANRRD